MSLFNSLIVHSLPFVPKFVVGAVSKRYIAGETLEEAIQVAVDLNRRGFMTTVDLLGEDTTHVEQARRAAGDYRRVLKEIAHNGIEGNISVKPTQLGLNLDMGLCADLFRGLIEEARALGYFVRVEMEDSSCTQATVELYAPRRLRQYRNRISIVPAPHCGRRRSRLSILSKRPNGQRCLRGTGRHRVPERRHDPEAVPYVVGNSFACGPYLAFATHDEVLIEEACLLVDRLKLPPTAYEFQMLLGVGGRLREKVVNLGRRMRVYVPFGSDWYPYSMRRIRENPKIAGYVLRSMLGRGQRTAHVNLRYLINRCCSH